MDIRTDPDLMSSDRSGTIQNAKGVLRKNSQDYNQIRSSKAGSVIQENLQPIEEDEAHEMSNIVSGDVEVPSAAAETGQNAGDLAGIFAQTANQQNKNKRGF